MATTYEAIATVTVGSGGAANIEFTSIPATYTDLNLLVSARGTTGVNYGPQCRLTFNNSGGTAYSWRNLEGYDSSAGSNSGSSQAYTIIGYPPSSGSTANTFGNLSTYIPNYAGSTNKSLSSDSIHELNSATLWIVNLIAGLWANTAAITSIKLELSSGNFAEYSTATLYGIKKD